MFSSSPPRPTVAPPSSQSGGLSILVSLLSLDQRQGFRLLELPEEVVEIIGRAGQGGSVGGLRLKSSAPRAGTKTGGSRSTPMQEQLHLCTADKRWAIRQVSTSNSVFITAPSQQGEDVVMVDGEEDGVDSHGSDGISIIAQTDSVLELLPAHIGGQEVEDLVRQIVPQVTDVSNLPQLFLSDATSKSRMEIVHNIPAPDTMVESALDRLCVIDVLRHPDPQTPSVSACLVPSPQLILDVWQRFIQACAITVTKLDQPLDRSRFNQVLTEMQTDDDESEDMYSGGGANDSGHKQHTQDIHKNIITTLLWCTWLALDVVKPAADISTPDHGKTSSPIEIIPDRFTSLIGKLLLQSRRNTNTGIHRDPLDDSSGPAPAEAIPTTQFLSAWRRLIPVEKWWVYCTLSALEGFYTVVSTDSTNRSTTVGGDTPATDNTEELISWSYPAADNGSDTGRVSSTGNVGIPTAAPAATTTGTGGVSNKHRKWHEKFAAQRDVKSKK